MVSHSSALESGNMHWVRGEQRSLDSRAHCSTISKETGGNILKKV